MRVGSLVTACGLAILLAGCAGTTSDLADSSSAVTPSPTPTPTPTPTSSSAPVLDPDLLLTISGRVTTESGNVADVSLEVYGPIGVDDPEAATWRNDLNAACGREFEYSGDGNPLFPWDQPGAAFLRSEVSVTPALGSSWPADARIGLMSQGSVIPQQSEFIITGVGHSSLRCSEGNSLLGSGSGTRILLNWQQPLADAGEYSDFFQYQVFGFWTFSAPRPEGDLAPLVIGTISDCSITVSDALSQHVAESAWADTWGQLVGPQSCEVGFLAMLY